MDGASFDYIVVGAGSAGCVLANRLTQDPRITVCLIEAGSTDRSFFTGFKVNLPVGNTILLSSPNFNWGYQYRGAEGLHHAGIPAHRGRLEGGSSSVNGMVYMRGHRRDYDGWAAAGNPGWGYDEVLPLFKRQENSEEGADDFHGVGGELNVARLRWLNPLTRGFLAAAEETQHPRNDDFNGARQEGFGPQHVTQKNGQRWSSARAFLHPVLRRPNLAVMHDSLTLRVRMDGRRATGVSVRRGGETHELSARREVVLSGGAFNSPQALMLSGIGPADHLRAHGVAVVHDLSGVGRNLHDHPSAWVQVEDRSAKSFALSARALPWLAAAAVAYVVARQGPLTSNAVEACGFLRSSPDAQSPDMQYTFMAAIKDFNRWVPRTHGFGVSATLLQPKSRGWLELASPDPAEPPALHPRFLEHEEDLARIVQGVRLARQIIAAPALDFARGAELRPGSAVTSVAGIEDYVRENLSTAFHPVGTCKMGPASDPTAVVDPTLKVHGIEGLRVIDASIMPTVTSGNTNAPTMMIAERGAGFIKNTF